MCEIFDDADGELNVSRIYNLKVVLGIIFSGNDSGLQLKLFFGNSLGRNMMLDIKRKISLMIRILIRVFHILSFFLLNFTRLS